MYVKVLSALLVSLLLVSAQVPEDSDEEVTVETVEESPTVDVPYESPVLSEPHKVYLAEHFDDLAQFEKRWIKSQAKKEDISEDIAKYDGVWQVEAPQKDGLIGDQGLVLKSKAKHAAISSSLKRPFVFDAKPLIVQYEVLFQDGQECGGAYLKLLTQGPETKNLDTFQDKTPYSIMFGPDKCGNDHKLHFIFRHRNPINGSLEEKHCNKPKDRIEDLFTDKLPHLYTLVLNPDNTFEISVDKKVVNSGSLLEDFAPAVNPPKEIDDPNDSKPEDWDEREKIPDLDATKPSDWDEDAPAHIVDETAVIPNGWLENEPSHVPDPNAEKPEDWDTEIDGEWEPPQINNPLCAQAVGCGPWEQPLTNNPDFKGKWRAPLIDNPNYKGKWRPKRIPNPDFFEDTAPFKMQPVAAIGFELWSMSKDILFDNLIVTDEVSVAEYWASVTYDLKRQKIAKDSGTLWGRIMKQINYKPIPWGLFFIYCAIPIGFYVWYLYFCVREESVIQKLATLTNDYPWLWAIYIVVLGIPVVFVLYLCCKPAGSPSASHAQEKEELRQEAARNKKTDDLTEDTVEPEEDKEGDKEDDDDEEDDREKDSGPDSEEESEKTEQENAARGAGEGARKRKPRKE